MLGLEVSSHTIRPKILTREGNLLRMCCSQSLNINKGSDIASLLKLLMAFLVLVDYRLS